jgi:dolichol-phosphate mannosyltransferase
MVDAGHRLVEVPIEFRDREHGTSKMRGAIIAEAMLKVTGWGIQRLWSRPRRVATG